MRWVLPLTFALLTVTAGAAEAPGGASVPVSPPGLPLRPVRFQMLPDFVKSVTVGPDQRPWYDIDPIPTRLDDHGARVGDLEAVKTNIEREFAQPAPKIAGAKVFFFESPPKGQPARVWFTSHFPYRVLGWDGKTWVEHDPNPTGIPGDIRAMRYYCGEVSDRGAHGQHSVNLQVGDTLLFPASDGVTMFDRRTGKFSHQSMETRDLKIGLIGSLDLTPTPDGGGALALLTLKRPTLWRYAAGQWKELPDLWTSSPRPPRQVILSPTGVWTASEKGTATFIPLEVKVPKDFNALVEELAADDFDRRERAQKSLVAMSAAARPLIQAAKNDRAGQPEILARLDAVLKKMTEQEKPSVAGKPVDGFDWLLPIDRRRVLVTTREKAGDKWKQHALVLDTDGGFAEIDASIISAVPDAHWTGLGTLPTTRPDQFWLYGSSMGRPSALVDIRSGKVLDTVPNAKYHWIQAVAADGTLYLGPGIPTQFPQSRPVMVYQPDKPDDRVALDVATVEIQSNHVCVASDGAIWASTEKTGVSRFDGKSWAAVPALNGIEVAEMLPGAQGEILALSRGSECALVVPGKPPIHAKTTRALIEANRDAIAAAFPAPKPGRLGPDVSLFADPAGNIWFKRYKWSVLTSNGWQEVQAAATAAGKEFQFFHLGPVGDGARVLLSGHNRNEDISFMVGVENGQLKFEKLSRPASAPPRGFVSDHAGGYYLAGGPVRHLTAQGTVDEPAGLGAEDVPLLVDLDGNLWVHNVIIRRRGDRLALWRDGKIFQTVIFPGVGSRAAMFADKPGSVWACNQAGIFHLVAKQGIYALDHAYAADDASIDTRYVQYSPLGYLVSVAAPSGRLPNSRSFQLKMTRLPK